MITLFWMTFIALAVVFYRYVKIEAKYYDYKYKYEYIKYRFDEIEKYFCNEICEPQGCGEFTVHCIKCIIEEIKSGIRR